MRVRQTDQFCAAFAARRMSPYAVQNGGSARGYRGAGRPLSSPGMAYRIVVCTVYLSIAPHGVNVRICRW